MFCSFPTLRILGLHANYTKLIRYSNVYPSLKRRWMIL